MEVYTNHGPACTCTECYNTRAFPLSKRNDGSEPGRRCLLRAMHHEGKAMEHNQRVYDVQAPKISDELKLKHMEAANEHNEASSSYRQAQWNYRDNLPKGAKELEARAKEHGDKADKLSQALGV